MELCLQPKLVDREEELGQLESYLDKAMQGCGSTVFISGEAGIGKTRLVEELKRIAESRGFQVLSGCSMFESLTPYMPFYEALKSGGLEYLFAEEAPRVEAVYLATLSGLMVGHAVREETKLNPDLFASMLTTVGDFVKESLLTFSSGKRRGGLNSLGYGNQRILIEAGRSANLIVILTGRENEFLVDDMRESLLEVDKAYGNTLLGWSGKEVAGVEEMLRPFFTSGKYDGVYYGKDDPRTRRNLLFENVSLGLARHSQIKPMLLCIEDLQWADPSSLALMHYVARNTVNCRLLMLGSYRPEDVAVADGKGHPLIHVMHLMNRENLCELKNLERLPRENVDEFLTAMLGQVDFDDELKDRMFKETDGNPLFMMQLVNYLVGEKVLRSHDGGWRLEISLDNLKIPPKIFSVISRRLARIEEEYRRTLDCASVIGEAFLPTVLAEALNLEKALLLEQLRQIEHKHMLVHPQDGAYKFDHSKIKETLYDEMPKELRVEYHLAVATSIEKINGNNIDEVVEDLAFHYNRCKNREKALHYLLKAAEDAKKEYSNEEAMRFYIEALEFEQGKEEKIGILENLAAIYDLVGQYDRSIRAYSNALDLAEGQRKVAELNARIGGVYEHKGEYEEALKVCGLALDLVRDEGSLEEALVRIIMGNVYERKGMNSESIEQLKKSLEISQRIGDGKTAATCLNTMGFSCYVVGDFNEGILYLERALPIWEEIGDQLGTAMCYKNFGALLNRIGEYDKALGYLDKGLTIAERIGNQTLVIHCLGEIGYIEMLRGDYDNPFKRYGRALMIGQRIGDLWTIAAASSAHSHLYFLKGDYEKALKSYQKSTEMAEMIDHKRGVIFNYSEMAEIHALQGNFDMAKEYCAKALNLCHTYGLKETLIQALKSKGVVYREAKMWKESTEAFEKCLEIHDEIGLKSCELGDAYYEFAMMWERQGKKREAETYLRKASGVFEKLKADGKTNMVRAELESLESEN